MLYEKFFGNIVAGKAAVGVFGIAGGSGKFDVCLRHIAVSVVFAGDDEVVVQLCGVDDGDYPFEIVAGGEQAACVVLGFIILYIGVANPLYVGDHACDVARLSIEVQGEPVIFFRRLQKSFFV